MATEKATVPETKTYTVTARITNVDAQIDVSAVSLAEAVAKAETLKLDDFVEAKDEICEEGALELRSIWSTED